jgi:hypothetical protein
VKQVYFDYSKSNLCDASGIALGSGVYPTISYEEDTVWNVQVFETLTGSAVAKNMSDAVSWEAAMDKVYNSTTAPMLFTVTANIDATGATTGLLKVDMNADTSTYLAAITAITTDQPLAAFFQLRGYDSGGDILYSIPFKVNALGCVYPSGITPPPPTSNYYTKSAVDGIVAGLQPIATLPAAVQAALSGAFTFDATTGKLTAINWLDSSNNPHTMTMNADGSLHTNP